MAKYLGNGVILIFLALLVQAGAFLPLASTRIPLRKTEPGALSCGMRVDDRGEVRSAACSRRHLLDLSVAYTASVVVGTATNSWAAQPVLDADLSNTEFLGKWPYAKPADILPYLYAAGKKGDVDSILAAMDAFGERYPMYKLGDEKGRILEEELKKLPAPPERCVELGTFLGYSAIRTARNLAPGGKLFCVEFNPEHAAVARAVGEFAGLGEAIEIVVGDSSEMLDEVRGALDNKRADFVLLDHRKNLYLPDLQGLERRGVVAKGTTVGRPTTDPT
jgi:predicted O-methyltransferase YrrM